jgi:hypothetical protein
MCGLGLCFMVYGSRQEVSVFGPWSLCNWLTFITHTHIGIILRGGFNIYWRRKRRRRIGLVRFVGNRRTRNNNNNNNRNIAMHGLDGW